MSTIKPSQLYHKIQLPTEDGGEKTYTFSIWDQSGRGLLLQHNQIEDFKNILLQWVFQNKTAPLQEKYTLSRKDTNPQLRKVFEEIDKSFAKLPIIKTVQKRKTVPVSKKPLIYPNTTIIQAYKPTGLQQPFGHQTCWALTGLQMLVLNNNDLMKNINATYEQLQKILGKDFLNDFYHALEGSKRGLPEAQKNLLKIADSLPTNILQGMPKNDAEQQVVTALRYEVTTHYDRYKQSREKLTITNNAVMGKTEDFTQVWNFLNKKYDDLQRLEALKNIHDAYAKNEKGSINIDKQLLTIFKDVHEETSNLTDEEFFDRQQQLFPVLTALLERLYALGIPNYLITAVHKDNQRLIANDTLNLSVSLPIFLMGKEEQTEDIRLQELIEESWSVSPMMQSNNFPKEIFVPISRMRITEEGNHVHLPNRVIMDESPITIQEVEYAPVAFSCIGAAGEPYTTKRTTAKNSKSNHYCAYLNINGQWYKADRGAIEPVSRKFVKDRLPYACNVRLQKIS